MVDVLFIFPPYTLEERYGSKKMAKVGGNLPPLGLAYIASYLMKHNFSVDIIDATVLELSEDELIAKIKKRSPRVIGVSALTPMYHRAVRLGERIKKEFPNTLLVIGGHHATIEPIKTLSETSYDLLVFGEGEETMLEIMQPRPFDKIKGLAFKNDNKIIINEKREPIADLNKLPDPAWELLPMDKYIPLPNQYYRLPSAHLLVIRGCPFDCSFCSCNAVFGRKIRKPSVKKVINMIKNLITNYGVKDLTFWDDTITAAKSWLIELCNEMIKEKLDLTWSCLSRVDTVTKEMLVLMKKAGCWNIFFGFESAHQKLLDNINKHTTPDQARKVTKWMREVGIEIRGSFMLALPGETPEMALETIKFAIELDPDYAQFSITTPYPGTKLYGEASKYGILHGTYSKYSLWNPVFVPYAYKDIKEIADMENYAMRKFYFRPRYIYNKLKKLRSKEDLFRYFKGLKMALGMVK